MKQDKSPTLHTRNLHADLETPVTAYMKLRQLSPWSFLYESVEGPKSWADFSILGFGAQRVFEVSGETLTVTQNGDKTTLPAADPLSAIRDVLRANPLLRQDNVPRFVGGIFGFLSYDAVRSFEPVPNAPSEPEVPDSCFIEPELLAVFNNRHHSLVLYAQDPALLDKAESLLRGNLPAHRTGEGWTDPTPCDSREHFQEAVLAAKEHILAGDIIQVVLSRRFELPRVAEPFDVYRGLRTINPSPYLYYFECPDLQIAGASPEVMVRVLDGRITLRPIAGTRPRGSTPAEDAAFAEDLLNDPKELAEHIMLVDLGRNDVGRVSQAGSVTIPHLKVIENYSHVMHIVSQVEGDLDPSRDAFDALRASFPAGTLSGAPKVRAMQIIDDLERQRRGIYGGAVGYFGPQGDADFGIAIRTLVAHPDRFVIQAGAGIVADSDPVAETDETEHKARAVVRAAQWAASRDAAW